MFSEADLGLLEAFNYYDKGLHLGCCSSPRSASGFHMKSKVSNTKDTIKESYTKLKKKMPSNKMSNYLKKQIIFEMF